MGRIDKNFSAWLRERLGPAIGIAVTPADRLYPLMPEEDRYVSNAVSIRRIEFSGGRFCARLAMGELGLAAQAIGIGPRGGPVWPQGVCGSITHSAGICAAVTARTTEVAGLGIDIVDLREGEHALASSAAVFASERELMDARLGLSDCGAADHALSILFSAKESAIKAMSAAFDRFVEFTEIEVRFDGSDFRAENGAFGTRAHGWWIAQDGCVFTAAVMRERTG